ncbi:MAG: septum site-determining protein MinC [Lachnospiraceae bacterium]
MSTPVTIKGNKYGVSVHLSETASYEEIKADTAVRFKEAEKFLGDAKVAVSFDGRPITDEQQRELIDIIQENCGLHIICIMDNSPETEERFKKRVDEALMEFDNASGQFHKGNLRSGQVLETETSIIILGDVNPGASVVSKGNIIILGSLKGTAFAGASGSHNCFVVAMGMQPMQIRIADIIARSPDHPAEEETHEPKIAFLEDGNIYIEPLSKSVLNDIKL